LYANLRRCSKQKEQNALSRGIRGPETETAAIRPATVRPQSKRADAIGTSPRRELRRQIVTWRRTIAAIPNGGNKDRISDMATALAPRIYGLDAICAAAAGTAGGEGTAQFARRLYQRVADKDLAAASVEQRAAAAVSLLAFARRRLPGVAKVRAFNPTIADHGFESRHTIVQIVNDDMPFLVDSIANEFNRRELSVHLLAHPVMAARRDLDGDLVEVAPDTSLGAGERARPESMMHVEIDRQADALQLDAL